VNTWNGLLQEGGANFETPDQFFQAAEAAYKKKQASARFGQGSPHWIGVDCSFDFEQYIRPFQNPNFGGVGHSTQLQVDEVTGEVFMGRKGSEVHFLHFYSFEGAWNPNASPTQYT
jgi:hypothetical protein